jgi:hypothetical protein
LVNGRTFLAERVVLNPDAGTGAGAAGADQVACEQVAQRARGIGEDVPGDKELGSGLWLDAPAEASADWIVATRLEHRVVASREPAEDKSAE